MRVLVTGASGQLGTEVVAVFRRRGHEVVAAGSDALDVTDRGVVLEALDGARPAAVVHAGAWTAVDACEGDPDRAFAVNALGTRHVAEAARRVGAHVCYVSTDYVFDGRSDRPYTEWDEPCPLSVYGRSKLGGEVELDPGSTVVRTSWVFGAHGSNMVKTVLRLAAGDGGLRFVDDQHGCPTSAADLAEVVAVLTLDGRPGVHHVTNQGATTWYGFAREVVAAAGGDPARVEPIATSELVPARPAPRPANSVLDNMALRAGGFTLLPDWHEPVERLVRELLSP